ncbi:MAG: hypothetical protein ABJE95_01965 [Byssovorax sp.]
MVSEVVSLRAVDSLVPKSDGACQNSAVARVRLDAGRHLHDAPREQQADGHVIAQTLHGYDQGHRLLAVGGDVDDVERSLLDRLSDLSGYVPLGTVFDRYHTGFPCGRYYAFACTWPDVTAVRAGTVHTHTLLIPRDALASLQDLYSLQRLHRRPDSAADRGAYREAVLPGELNTTDAAPTPSLARALSAIVLWFGQADRPVLWVEETRPDDIVRYLWSLLWPEARWNFTFCTFALQVRFLRRQPFGFLSLPPSARGSFHERARSAAWWTEEKLAQTSLRERTGDAWAQTIFEQGASATFAMLRFCTAEGLPALSAPDYPTFYRFIELEAPSTARLTAARARADLLARLWPDVAPTHPLVRATLDRLLGRQADAPLTPRPFWELGDFLARPAVGTLVKADTDLASTVASVVGDEIRRRLPRAVPTSMTDLIPLLQVAPVSQVRFAILDAVRAVVAGMTDEADADSAVCALLKAATDLRDPALAETALSALPPARRRSPALTVLQQCSVSDRPRTTDYILTAANRLDDPGLAFDTWVALADPGRGLTEAELIVLASPTFEPERLRPVLAPSGAEATLTWALCTTDVRMTAWAAARGAEAANQLRLSLSTLLDRCESAPNGAPVLRAYVESLPISALSDDMLFSLPMAMILTSEASGSPAAKRIIDHAALRLVSQLAQGRLDASQRAIWLESSAIQGVLASTSPWTLFGTGGTRASDSNCLPNLAKAIGDQVSAHTDAKIVWVQNLLARPLEECWNTSIERAEDDLSTVLSVPSDRDGWTLLAAEVLVAVRRTGCTTAHRLVQQTFSVLYPRLQASELASPVKALLSRFTTYGWDVAKGWRHWLLDVWVDHRWPPASFLSCLGDDEALFFRIADRAKWKWRGRDFMESLREALRADSALAQRWAAPVARALGEERLPTDYD